MMRGQDELLYEMHMRGMSHDEIAAKFGIKPERVIHEMTRILNEKAGYFGIGDPRNTFKWKAPAKDKPDQ